MRSVTIPPGLGPRAPSVFTPPPPPDPSHALGYRLFRD